MEVNKLYPSQRCQGQLLEQSRLIWPFYDSHQQARHALLQAEEVFLLKGKTARLVIAVTRQKNCWQITNLLTPDTDQISWEQALGLLETAARQKFLSQLQLKLSASSELVAWLCDRGYQQIDQGFEKELRYHTGLVLGGGGAHGAYQIGAWQALLERDLHFELVAGTSVGALNGALIAQQDVAAARQLWEKIETSQVLAFTYQQLDEADFNAQLDLLRNFVKEALRAGGLSTEPLRQLLTKQIDFAALTTSVPLYVVTTKLPNFTEIVVRLDHQPKTQMIDWLLASSAFFPLMAIVQIVDGLYVDGGYRNNLPQDVALNAGARELITIDIHGPGIDRNIKVPDDVAQLVLRTAWSLGDLLLFQASRCQGNLQLGYLEMKRQLEDLPGTWYTFNSELELRRCSAKFIRYLQTHLRLTTEELQTLAQDVPLELLCLPLLEQWGRWLKLSPLTEYSVASFKTLLLAQLEKAQPLDFPLTVQEQWRDYWQSHNYFSDYQQVTRLVRTLSNTQNPRLFRGFLKQQLLAWFLIFLQRE